MARPTKDTVEWVPQFTDEGKTIPVVESKFGNDGYTFWRKLLGYLGKSHGQTCNFSEDIEWEFFLSCCRVSAETGEQIMALLAKLGAIDRDLWEKNRIVWSQNLVEFLTPLYQKRKVSAPEMPDPAGFPLRKLDVQGVSAPEMRRREEKRREEKEDKYKVGRRRPTARVSASDSDPSEEQSSEPEPPEQESTTEPDLDDIENATRLMEAVNAIEPGYTKRARVNFDGWSNEFRLIRQQDHRPQADVVFVIEQFPKHEFWSRNIRSPGALRGRTSSGGDKFLKILSDLKTQKPNGATNGRAKNNAMPDPAGSRAVLKHFGITDDE